MPIFTRCSNIRKIFCTDNLNPISKKKGNLQLRYATILLLLFSTTKHPPVQAFQISNKRQAIAATLIRQGVEPIIADCAAHASFVVPISQSYQKIEFNEDVLHAPSASIEIWNKAFGSRKQRIEVDKIVTIQCRAQEKNKKKNYRNLKLRCGYVKNMLLAFDFFDPASIPQKKRIDLTSQNIN